MRIIKPYGRSNLAADSSGRLQRTLLLSSDRTSQQNIETFAKSHDELVIAQWISTIDKIVAIPKGTSKPSADQHRLRERIGKAAWSHLVSHNLLPGLADPDTAARLIQIWDMRIASYGEPVRSSSKSNPRTPRVKGRWYQRFAGDVAPGNVDAEAVALRIHEHLYERAYRLGSEKKKLAGHIEARARSIAENGLHSTLAKKPWDDKDVYEYSRFNVAQDIRTRASKREKGEDGAGTTKVTASISGAALYEHWARLMVGKDGKPLPVAQAKSCHPGLFALHMAVKDCYARLLKRHRKHPREDERRLEESAICRILPHDMESLLQLVEAMRTNRDLSALVRLGKVIHYTSSDPSRDDPENLQNHWPATVSGSYFWTSDGQAGIKRNEAFVRVWRHVIGLAARTAKDWADPAGRLHKDILGRREITTALSDSHFDPDAFDRKCALLFGAQASLFTEGKNIDFKKSVLESALKALVRLRNSSFHFTGRGGFLKALEGLGNVEDVSEAPAVRKILQQLIASDRQSVAERTRTLMQSAQFPTFLQDDQIRCLYTAIITANQADLPLPRFSQILKRAQIEKLLPPAVNRLALQDPARNCQFHALKLLYERPFRAWLTACEAELLNGFIGRAIARSTNAARALAKPEARKWSDLIIARVEALGQLERGDGIHAFFSRLSAATASEMRVQNGYQSDGERAREQSAYIEKFKCEVLALAFRHYLDKSGFGFLLTVDNAAPIALEQRCALDGLPKPPVVDSSGHWEAMLYCLLHLVPVDAVSQLLHQLRKWEILAATPEPASSEEVHRNTRLQEILGLYLDMHDAKFSGVSKLTGTDAFRKLFEDERDFETVFPRQGADDEVGRVALRGLREIMRFGDHIALSEVFRQFGVTRRQVADYLKMETPDTDGTTPIAHLQLRREALHETWVLKGDKGFGPDERRGYVEALSGIVRHRHLSAQVLLTNHTRLHRLLMTVLGRLVDFAGLWERDLYFVSLALIHSQGETVASVFDTKGRNFLLEGRIRDALRHINDDAPFSLIDRLRSYFGPELAQRNDPNAATRNDLMHFNPLNDLEEGKIDLTDLINRTRQLMKYDRKLKNAVSKSVSDLLAREGIDVVWEIAAAGAYHRLDRPCIASRHAQHLGSMRLFPANSKMGERGKLICETLHGAQFVAMVASMFNGRVRERPQKCVSDLSPGSINWQQTHQIHQRKGQNYKKGKQKGPVNGRKSSSRSEKW
ncbi:type VI-A CRISPR-associated RNA-guided ribonuclease Cas13a [Nitratireductor rhodophyticola]